MTSALTDRRPPPLRAAAPGLPLTWKVEPLPDFLADHTLTGQGPAQRLPEVVARWMQLVGSLWGWRNRATFALRYLARGGRTSVHLLARPHDPAASSLLAGDISVLLRAHRLGDGAPLAGPEARAAHADGQLENLALVELRQYEARGLWKLPQAAQTNHEFNQLFHWLSPADRDAPPVVYPWAGPGGPFLVPMESLLSQPIPVTLTVYLAPTEVMPHEGLWLARMASEAQTLGEQTQQAIGTGASRKLVDPAASLAGRLYASFVKRLAVTPFLVAVHCAASGGRLDVARSLAGAMQALVHEPPLEKRDGDEAQLPTGATVDPFEDNAERQSTAFRLYRELTFAAPERHTPLLRLGYLADVRGASTVFRLPVSVQGGVPGVPVRQLAPDFHPGVRHDACPPGHVQIGRFQVGGVASVPLKDLAKHALITGFTGSGKTTTVLHLLHQLWNDHGVPFLVIESAKQEYRGLLRVNSWKKEVAGADRRMRAYTLGNESCAPFRFNPLELMPGVRLESHLGRLQTCFEAAMPQIGPLPSLLAEALERIYCEDRGWLLTDAGPEAGEAHPLPMPRMSDLYAKIGKVVHERGYQGEVLANVEAAVAGRIKPLLMGSKGRMFDTARSVPAEELFSRPVILEMNDLNEQDKSLVVMFLLTLLREYRELHPGPAGKLVHVTVVEEAHNVLENVASHGASEVGSDTKGKAVQAFCNMLAEVRSYGQGLIIADQSPEKLAPDAMRNTNVQIAHQLRDGKDRAAVANAMIMSDEQRDFLGKLEPGRAAVFFTGLQKATFVTIPRYSYPPGEAVPAGEEPPGQGFAPVEDFALADYMSEWTAAGAEPLVRFGAACAACPNKCEYRKPMIGLCQGEAAEKFEEIYAAYDADAIEPSVYMQRVARLAVGLADRAGYRGDPHAGWCAFLHLMYRDETRRDIAVGVMRETAREWFDHVQTEGVADGED